MAEHGGRLRDFESPEQALWSHVLEQALRDLRNPSDLIRGEAVSFFTSPGSFAKSRREIFALLGIDEESFIERIKPLFEYTPAQKVEIPRGEFTVREISEASGWGVAKVRGAVAALIIDGKVEILPGRGRFRKL